MKVLNGFLICLVAMPGVTVAMPSEAKEATDSGDKGDKRFFNPALAGSVGPVGGALGVVNPAFGGGVPGVGGVVNQVFGGGVPGVGGVVNPAFGGGFPGAGGVVNPAFGGVVPGAAGVFNPVVGGVVNPVGGVVPVAVSPVINPVAPPSSCRYWCRTPKGQAYCCEGANEAQTPVVGTKPGNCPTVRPDCPPTRFGPQKCSNDYRCAGTDKCCYDTCLEQHVCKPLSFFGR